MKARRIEIFCSEELYFPDYSSRGLDLVRSKFGMASFQTCWAFEESKHSLAFREYLTRSGLRSEAECVLLEANVIANAWTLPFGTARQMECYGALQESATYTAYRMQKHLARDAGDKVLEAIFYLVARDEAAHGGFYRSLIELELAEDRDGTIADLAYVLANFKMPGDGLIPNYRERLECSGAGISPRAFVERVILPAFDEPFDHPHGTQAQHEKGRLGVLIPSELWGARLTALTGSLGTLILKDGRWRRLRWLEHWTGLYRA